MQTSDWNKWDAQNYLQEFYGNDVAADEIETILFLSRLAKNNPASKILDFGCGPTLHHIFPFAPHVSEIHLADLLNSNLKEISKYLNNEIGSHSWDQYIEYALSCESQNTVTKKAIHERKRETRRKVTKLIEANARNQDPLGPDGRGTYPIVMSCFCADSATDHHNEFAMLIENIASLVEPGGLFIVTCLRNATFYKAKHSFFPSANVDEKLLGSVLIRNFIPDTVEITVKHLPNHADQGYTGIIMATARK